MGSFSTFNLVADRYVEGKYFSPAAQLAADQCSGVFSAAILIAEWMNTFCSSGMHMTQTFKTFENAFRQAKVVIGITSLFPLVVKGIELIISPRAKTQPTSNEDTLTKLQKSATQIQKFAIETLPSFASDVCSILIGLKTIGLADFGKALVGIQITGSVGLMLASGVHLYKEMQQEDLTDQERWIIIAKDVSAIALGVIGCIATTHTSGALLIIGLTVNSLWIGLDLFHYYCHKKNETPVIKTQLMNATLMKA